MNGCTSKSELAQIDDRQNMVFTRHGTMEVIRVFPADTIESIAQQRHVPIEILAAVNNIPYPYHLYNVRTLMIPQEKYHKVKSSGESLKSIAKKYRVDLMQLIDMNNMMHIPQNKTLQIGMIIKIPKQHYVKQHVERHHSLEPVYTPTKEYDVMELNEVKDDPVDHNVIAHENDKPSYVEKPVSQEESVSLDFEKELQETKNQDMSFEPKIESSFKTTTPLNSDQFVWPLTGKVSRDDKNGIIMSEK
jgi:LysM repeat protein